MLQVHRVTEKLLEKEIWRKKAEQVEGDEDLAQDKA